MTFTIVWWHIVLFFSISPIVLAWITPEEGGYFGGPPLFVGIYTLVSWVTALVVTICHFVM